jgi:hypothetical protein
MMATEDIQATGRVAGVQVSGLVVSLGEVVSVPAELVENKSRQ